MRKLLWAFVLVLLFMAALLPGNAAGTEGDGAGRAGSAFVRMDLPFSPELSDAAWMPDGSSMLAVGPDGWILRYHPDNRTFVNVNARGAGWVPDYKAVAISPATSEALVVGDGGMAVRVSTGDRVTVQPTGTQSDLLDVSYMSDGSMAFLAGANRTLVEYDPSTRTMTVQDSLLMPGLADIPANTNFGAVSIRPDGQYALVAAPEAGRMYRLSDSGIADISYKFMDLSVPTDICWSPDGSRALVLSNRSVAYLWDGAGESCAQLSGPPGSRMVLGAWRNATSASLLSLGTAGGLYEYSGQPALGLAQSLEASAFRAMSWSPDGKEGFIFAVEGVDAVAYHVRDLVIPKPSKPGPTDINSTAVYLTWSWSPGDSGEKLDHYVLLHSTSETDLLNATPLNAHTNTSGRLYNLIPSTKYYLLIRVVTQNDLSADSEVQSFSTTAFTLPQPVGPYFDGYTLRWQPSTSPNISKYDLYYAQMPGQAVEGMPFVATFPAGQASYSYSLSSQLGTTFREGTTYYFRVRTVNRDGGTADSGEAAFKYDTAPRAVSAVKITDITYNSVRLTWSKSDAADFSAYVIEYRPYMSGTWKTALKVTDKNTTSAVIGSLESDTKYDFRIKVQDKGGKTSGVSEWAVHPRTEENIAYDIFSTVFGDPVVCLPISFMLLFMTIGGAAGMAKSGKGRGSAVFGTFAAGFAMLVVVNLLQLMEIWQPSWEMKLLLFLLPMPVAAVIAGALWWRARRAKARSAEEARRRQAEEDAARRQKQAEELRTTLGALGGRLSALERIPGQGDTAAARMLLQQAGYAFSTGNLQNAQDLAQRAETGMREMEDSSRDRQSQAEAITRRLENVDSHLRTLIDHWLKYDPAAELGLDPLRIERARLEAARKQEDSQLQSAQARQQQAGVLLGQGRLAEAKDVAAQAQSEVDRMLDGWNQWKDLKDQAGSLLAGIESAASWASIDSRSYRRRLEDAKLELAVQDRAAAAASLNAIRAELGALGQTHRPMLGIALPPREYRLNRFEDFQFTVRNTGKAVARKIDIALEAPADFGPGGAQPIVKLVSMAPGGLQDCRLNLCFTREGSVPVLFSPAFEDNAGNRIVQEPVRLTVSVLGR